MRHFRIGMLTPSETVLKPGLAGEQPDLGIDISRSRATEMPPSPAALDHFAVELKLGAELLAGAPAPGRGAAVSLLKAVAVTLCAALRRLAHRGAPATHGRIFAPSVGRAA